MDIKEILKEQPEEVVKKLTKKPERKVSLDTCINQYDPTKHDVFDPLKRPQKKVKKATGTKDENGNEVYEDATEEVVRIGIPMQKLIVSRTVGFVCGNPIELEEEYVKESKESEKVLDMVKKIWKDNKLDFKNREILEILMSECEVAELWYLEENPEYWGDMSKAKFKLRQKILSSRTKDELFPVFSPTGDMIAFCRKYTLTNDEGKKVEHFDVYSNEKNLFLIKEEGGSWMQDPERKLDPTGKIHVIYYKIDQPDWYDVQSMIDRLETTISNTGDTNDYSGSPITVVKGQIMGFASKGERGKILETEKDGDITYLESKNAPDSVKMEVGILDDFIKEMTQTPNVTFEAIKGLGNLSGIALKLLFTDAHSKAQRIWGTFGEGIQRRLNLLKYICGFIDSSLQGAVKNLTITPTFTPYLPEDEESWNKMITESLALGAISKQTAAENLTFVSDPNQEIDRIKQEQTEDLGRSFE